MKKLLFALCISTLITTVSFGKKKEIKLGNIDLKELKEPVCSIDSSAHAAYLVKIVNHKINYTEKYFKIKIYDKDGLHMANHTFAISSGMKPLDIKGNIYNFENGEVIKTELTEENYFEVLEANNHIKQYRIAFPNVRKGSVIELYYKIQRYDPYFGSFYFQEEIPVKYCKYESAYPDYLTVKNQITGYTPITPLPLEYANTRFNTYNVYKYKANNLPAVKKEKYVSTLKNYVSKINHTLTSINFAGYYAYFENIASNWDDINKKLNKHEKFGKILSSKYHYKKDLRKILANKNEQEQILDSIYKYVQAKIKYNNVDNIFTGSYSKALKNGTGNSATINLTLTSMLRAAGFNAYPVICSTRENGIIPPTSPSLTYYNYIFCAVENHDGYIYLDATSPNLPLGTLPEKCFNGQGRLIDIIRGKSIDINFPKHSLKINNYYLTISKDNTTGTCISKSNNYFANRLRDSLKLKDDKDDYREQLEKQYNITISQLNIKNQEKINKPIFQNIQFEPNVFIDLNDSSALIDISNYFEIKENPFKLNERIYPVDYTFLREYKNSIQIQIPESHKISYTPENITIALPESKIIYNISYILQNNTLLIKSSFKINNILFLPSEYSMLKDFYSQVIKKQSEQILIELR